MAQKMTGALVFDERTDRYDIRFDLNSYYGGLHCGECFDVFVRGKWKPTRIEYGDNWYLVGIRAEDLNGRDKLQDEVNEKTIALYIKTGKLTAQTLQKAMKAILSKGKKQLAKPPQGKQSLKQLMKQNAGVSNIEITEGNIKAFESTAKKYGIDFALKKDATESPPRYLVFFKGRDADVLTAAFKEFSAKKLTQEKKPSIRKLLSTLKEAAQGKNAERAKVKNKDREVSL